jgi:hypothetical protein
VLLGEAVHFDGPTEKWIVWPATGQAREPREEALASHGIRVVSYTPEGEGRYRFNVGQGMTPT